MTIKDLPVEKVLVAPAEDIASEAYVGIIVDRAQQARRLHGQPRGRRRHRGGRRDRTRTRSASSPSTRATACCRSRRTALATALYDDVKQQRAAAKILQQLYAAFMASGASLAEINPLVTTPDGEVKALDAKFNIDDNELFRRPEIEALRDDELRGASEETPRARRTSRSSSSTATSAACVNGAGLAMATMDLVKYYGGEPANFLDIGGSSNPEKVVNALRIITERPEREGHLLQHLRRHHPLRRRRQRHRRGDAQIDIEVPIVIRLTGTNEEKALEILEDAGFSA
jgi:succinyl-CoA synthetase beta subunit